MFKNLVKLPLIGRLLLILYRIWVGLGFVLGVVGRYVKWLFVSKETTNLTYHHREDNLIYLEHFIAAVSGKTYLEIRLYFNEILDDKAFYVPNLTKLR